MFDRADTPRARAKTCGGLAAVAAAAHENAVKASQGGFRRLASGFQRDGAYFARRALECRLTLLGIDLEDER